MKIYPIQGHNYGLQNSNRKVQQQNLSFGKVVTQVAEDSFAPLVKKGLNRFMNYMRELATQAVSGSEDAQKKLTSLIGQDATSEIVRDAKAYTNRTKQITKALPLSGHGTRGSEIRNTVTDALNLPRTNKTDLPLPAVIGRHKGKDIYLTTANNELLHMMEAKTLSPFERLDHITTKASEGDATVLIEGLKSGKISRRKPVLFTYTDDVGTKGYQDYSELTKRYKEVGGAKSPYNVISRGYMATKQEAAGTLGTFLPEGKAFAVYEKPSLEQLNQFLPGDQMVMTNIGKTLFTPKGLADIDARRIADPMSLTKMDKGVPKWHVTEGILKPAGREGALDVIPKGGQFADIGNGTIFTDTMLDIASGKFNNVFPKELEAQIAKNVTANPDGLSATFKYGDKFVTLPTSKA